MHSLRVQTDRKQYHMYMKHLLEQTEGLELKQAEITAVCIENGHVTGIETNLHGVYDAKAVVLATGTSLGGKILLGMPVMKAAGRHACRHRIDRMLKASRAFPAPF